MKVTLLTYLTSFFVFIAGISIHKRTFYKNEVENNTKDIDSLYNIYMLSKKHAIDSVATTLKVSVKTLKKDVDVLKQENEELVTKKNELVLENKLLKKEIKLINKHNKAMLQNGVKKDSFVVKRKKFFGRLFSKTKYDTIKK